MINKVLLLGSGGLKIGEAGEFDYSGSQAIKALQEEGIETVLVNPNIATVQTGKDMADDVYFLPVTADFVTEVIKQERPDGILLSFGGQTALNCGVELQRRGVLEQYDVDVLGTPVETIELSEDRGAFRELMRDIDVKMAKSAKASSVDEAKEKAAEIGYPVIVRSEYSLGGKGSGFADDEDELEDLARRALSASPNAFIQESVKGWKEVEYEVVRDRADNCITVCNMENFDPLGIHTGESIVVAPSQTLSNEEYHYLRDISQKVIRELGVIGECNIQFAVSPDGLDYRVIEVNARLSRSSALASKATGYPLAFIAAKLSLGKTLIDIKNPLNDDTSACFEPALDYVTVKLPRWDFAKFRHVSRKIGSGMKSVGEVMAIGRTFEEALQKGIRMVGNGQPGFACSSTELEDVRDELTSPSDKRLYAIHDAFEQGYSVDEIHDLTKIDDWYLHKLKRIYDLESELKTLDEDVLREAKQLGFSDAQVEACSGRDDVRSLRKQYDIVPVVKKIDTLAAEFPATSNYLYVTYNGEKDDVTFDEKTVIVLGSGAYRIGSSVEFDWGCVSCLQQLRERGYSTAMINYNPETVSTDYDVSDKLYFDELSLERILDICDKERVEGVVVSFGGQIPNGLALKLENHGVPVLGTPPEKIDNAENRHRFSATLDELGVDQPAWEEFTEVAEAKRFAEEIGYPVLIRPSYVLSGAAMNVAGDERELRECLNRAAEISEDYPVLISDFIRDAKEIEMDAVAEDGEIVIYAISEHVERAGVHSGDSTLVFPPQKLYVETVRRIKKITRRIAERFEINGPFNVQYLAKDNEIKVIECNLRTSRSFPFVSKVLQTNLVEIATDVLVGEHEDQQYKSLFDIEHVGVKVPQFSFTRLAGADPTLSVEMSSTGEVACLGHDPYEAFLKALLSTGFKLPGEHVLLSIGPVEEKAEFLESARKLAREYTLHGTEGTAAFLDEHGVACEAVTFETAKKYIQDGDVSLVINMPTSADSKETQGYLLRQRCLTHDVPLITDVDVATTFVEALEKEFEYEQWSSY
jgi:carbamoyl-phosphate synthase large subunit